jgi:hypothetical protein
MAPERREVHAALEARRELGPEYDDEVVDALVEKIERKLDERRRPPRPHEFDLRLAFGSMGVGIPVTAVANSNAEGACGVVITIVAWIAIAIINVAYARRR